MIGIAKGMVTTFKHLFKPTFTIQYPNVKRPLPERSRMSFALGTDESGAPQCKACLLCEKSCPDDAIKIDSEKVEGVPGRVLTRFAIDLGRCMYCGLCVEQCSTQGLRHTGDFENSVVTREETVLVLYAATPESLAAARPLEEPSPPSKEGDA